MAFRSLTTRLSVFILLAGGAVFAATLVASNRIARQTALAAAEAQAVQVAERLVNRVRGVLSAVEESAELLATTAEALDLGPPDLERLLRRYVAGEPDVFGSAVAYAPGAYRRGRELFAPYVYGHSTSEAELRLVDLGTGSYDYPQRVWYRGPAATGKAAWSEPYVDEGASGQTMVTYSVPFFARDDPRRLRGVATADVPLDWLTRLVSEVKIGKTGQALILSREGRILAHPALRTTDAEARLLEQLSPEGRQRVEPIVRRMLAGQAGFQELEVGGRRGRLLYQPIGTASWSLAVFYPEDELMEGARRLRAIQAPLGFLGLALLALVVIVLSRRLTAPLRELAAAARGLASDLEAELPPARSRDELGLLASELRDMRDALRKHVHDLQLATAARERLESELKIARRIQMEMLPRTGAGSREEGYELAALLEPARAVGGDLYDHFAQGGRVFFLVADVSGKGVAAALFMARTKTLFEAAAARLDDPARVLTEVNRGLCREDGSGMYVTAVCGVLDTGTGELAFACAGHEPPIHLQAGAPPEPFGVEGGTVLGLFDTAEYRLNIVRLAPGEAIVACTDGVTEAFDPNGDLFGSERLLEALRPLAGREASQVNATALAAVRAFAAGAKQSDDITLLTLRYVPARRG